MGWEDRKGKRYYYRSRRIGGRVVKEYVGNSPMIGACEAMDRERASTSRLQLLADLAYWDVVDEAIAEVVKEAKSFADLVIMAAGYHRRNRGIWRKKRNPIKMDIEFVDALKEEKAIRAFVVPETHAERLKIVREALTGGGRGASSAQAIACLRQYPDTVTIGFTDSTQTALEAVTNGIPILMQIVRGEAAKQRDDLLGTNPSPLERILVDRIVACSLQLGYMEREYNTNLEKGMSLEKSDGMQKRLDRVHKRHLSAIKALAQVRKLQIPDVSVALPGSTQVNIGKKQVNMAGPGSVQQNIESAS